MSKLLDFAFPIKCLSCGKVGERLCPNCIKRKNIVNWHTICPVCDGKVRHGFIHQECLDQSYLDGHMFVANYSEEVKRLVTEGKYSFLFSNFYLIGKIMGKYLKLFSFDENTLLVPVPLHWQRKNWRGFNQAEVIAKEISKISGIKTVSLLKRNKFTTAQAELSQEQREQNLVGAFRIENKIINDLGIQNLKVILIDDVYTTGSTLSECAKVLKQNGVGKVYGFTFAKSRKTNC